MSQSTPSLDELAADLERRGDDNERLELVRRARNFKRAWIEMAEALVLVERSQTWKRWGYESLHDYAEKELRIKRPTVEKLTLSYLTVRKHAPKVLARDGVETAVPSMDAVDYFVRALRKQGDDPTTDAEPGSVRELKAAVFDEVRPIAAIRKEFNPVFFQPAPDARERELLEKTRTTTRRLLGLLRNLDFLRGAERQTLVDALEGLETKLSEAIPTTRDETSSAA
ncbi:MAG: hypothetical protein R3A78_08285 [Polyangiales bacterium]